MRTMSREPDMGSRVQYPSIPELKDGFEDLTNRIARKAKLRFRGRKLRSGPLHNAVMLHFLTLPEDEQIEIAEEGLRRYEALLQLDEPADDLGPIIGRRPERPDPSGDCPLIDAATAHAIPLRPGRQVDPGGQDLSVVAKHRRPPKKK